MVLITTDFFFSVWTHDTGQKGSVSAYSKNTQGKIQSPADKDIFWNEKYLIIRNVLMCSFQLRVWGACGFTHFLCDFKCDVFTCGSWKSDLILHVDGRTSLYFESAAYVTTDSTRTPNNPGLPPFSLFASCPMSWVKAEFNRRRRVFFLHQLA